MVEPGDYRARVKFDGSAGAGAAEAQSNPFSVRYPGLRKGDKGPEVALYNNLLAKQGYATSSGKKYTQITAWATLAFRKVQGMSRVQSSTSGIFKTLAEGKGAYQLQHPGAGRHAEVSLAKQVLVLADGDKPQLTYHISSGAMATPSDPGGFRFYRKDAGYNSLGMYYSAYYNRGEATHGYKSVPDASRESRLHPDPDPAGPAGLQLDPGRDADVRLPLTMRIFLAGASGVIGPPLVSRLVADGHEVSR